MICAFHRIMTDSNSIRLSIPLILIITALAFSSAGVCAQRVQLVPLFSITGDDSFKKLNMPSDVFVDDKHGEIYVVDAGNRRIVIFEIDGFYKHQFTIPGKDAPNSLAVNSRGEILVAIGGRIALCDFRGELLEYVDFHGFPYSGNVNASRMRIDKQDNYYVLDAARRRVLVFDNDWNFKFGIDKESFPKTARNLTHGEKQEQPMVESLNISEICVDNEGMIYLLDATASRAYVFNHEGEYERSIGEPGAAFNTLSLPFGVAVDSQDRVLVTDSTGHGLLGYDKEGKFLFALGGLGKSEGRFYFPKHVSTDGSGRIYVIEPFLGRVQVLTTKLRPDGDDIAYTPVETHSSEHGK